MVARADEEGAMKCLQPVPHPPDLFIDRFDSKCVEKIPADANRVEIVSNGANPLKSAFIEVEVCRMEKAHGRKLVS